MPEEIPTERVTQIWPQELKNSVREKAGPGGLTEFTIEAVEQHLGVAQDLDALRKELGETRYFAQQMADQIVLGIESPEERLQTLMELEFPSWIDTSGWPETYAARVRPDIPEPFKETTEAELVEQVSELAEQAESPRAKAILEAAVDEGFKPVETVEVGEAFEPPKLKKGRDDLFAKVMAKTGGKLVDVPGLKVASEIEKPVEKPAPRKIDLEDIEVDF